MKNLKQNLILLKEYIIIFLCLTPYAWCVNQMLVPHTIISGALTGLCEIIYFATNTVIPIWASNLVLNSALLLIAGLTVGWKFCIRSIFGVFSLAFWLKLIPIVATPIITDPFMAVIISGMINGCCLGLIFINNGSSGGTDIIAMIVNRYRQIQMGQILFLCDLIIIGCAWFLPQITRVEQLFFGLCFTLTTANVVDVVMNKIRSSVQFTIFSSKYKEISDAINKNAHRGTTILDGHGGFTGNNKKVVVCLAKEVEAYKIFNIVREIDPEAFISEVQAKGVFGNGFERIKIK